MRLYGWPKTHIPPNLDECSLFGLFIEKEHCVQLCCSCIVQGAGEPNKWLCATASMHTCIHNIHYAIRHTVQYDIIMMQVVLAQHPHAEEDILDYSHQYTLKLSDVIC